MSALVRARAGSSRGRRWRGRVTALAAGAAVLVAGGNSSVAETNDVGVEFTSAASASQTDTSSAPSGDPIKVGVILPESGPFAQFGLALKRGVELFSEAQAEGFAGLGRPVEFVFKNDNSDPTQAAAAAQELVADEDVVAIIGGAVSALMLAIYPVVTDAEVPTIFLSPNEYPSFNQTPFVYSTPAGRADKNVDVIQPLIEQLAIEPDEVYVALNNDASGEVWSSFTSAAGWNSELFPADLTAFGPYIASLESAGARLLVSNSGAGLSIYVREAQVDAGFDIPHVIGPSSWNRDLVETLGDKADGLYVSATPATVTDPENLPPEYIEGVEAIRAAYEEYGTEDDIQDIGLGSVAWDNALSIALAAEGIDDLTRENLNDSLGTQSYTGTFGEIQRDVAADDHVGQRGDGYVLAVFVDGALRTYQP